MSGWDAADWAIFLLSFAGWIFAGYVVAELVHRSGRKLVATHKAGERWTADREEWGTRPSWTQVSALEFVRYGRAVGGARWELERVIFEDTPAGRLAAKRFQMEENVKGPKVLHTRDQGGR